MNLKFMEQSPCIGYDQETGQPNYTALRGERGSSEGVPQPVKGTWDVVSIKVTVLPNTIA
jgi:hypothetical protein